MLIRFQQIVVALLILLTTLTTIVIGVEPSRRPTRSRHQQKIQPVQYTDSESESLDESVPSFEDEFGAEEEPEPVSRRAVPRKRPANRSALVASNEVVESGPDFSHPTQRGTHQTASAAGYGFAPDNPELPALPDELRDFNDLPRIREPEFLETSDKKAAPAGGIDPRITALEKRLADMEKQIKKKADDDKKKKDADSTKFSFKPTGQVQLDTWFTGQDETNRATVGDMASDGIFFRRARLGATGELWETIDYRLEWEFAFPSRPGFLDNWVQIKRLPVVNNVKIGRYFEPWSLDRVTPNRVLTFLERSLLDTFAPARNNGIMAYNSIMDERATWAAGLFRSATDPFGGNFGQHSGWAGSGRVTALPYYDDSRPDCLQYLHVGAAYSLRYNANETVSFATFPEARLLQTSAPPVGPQVSSVGIPAFVDTGAIHSNHFQLIGFSGAWVNGPLSVQGEYAYVPVQQIGGPDLAFDAAYVYVSYFLTGESRPYNKALGVMDRVQPRTNFWKSATATTGAPRGPGAWELALRWSYINLNNKNINGGRLHNITFGLNWYLNAYTRVQLNYVMPFLSQAPFGDSTAHFFGIRAAFDF